MVSIYIQFQLVSFQKYLRMIYYSASDIGILWKKKSEFSEPLILVTICCNMLSQLLALTSDYFDELSVKMMM